MVTRWTPVYLVVCLWLLGAPNAHGWGDTGHQIICEIAFQELNAQARAEVMRLLQRDTQFSTFSQSCIWPDHPRKRKTEHFVNLPRSAAGIETDSCPLATTCTVTAITKDRAALADTTRTDAKRREALKYLGHWVGDVHQPLHVSFKDDRGGNEIDAQGPCLQRPHPVKDLHAVWDTCMIEAKLGTDIPTIATDLRTQVTETQRAQWNSTSPKDWANESFQLTTSPDVQYCVKKANACWYDATNQQLDPDDIKKVVTVNDAYMAQHLPTIKLRLMQAGVRLGRLLNQALGGA